MKVIINNHTSCRIFKKFAQELTLYFLQKERISCDEVYIHYVSPQKIKKLHKEFFNDPSLTDCITFPIDATDEKAPSPRILGEIFICPYTAKLYAKKMGSSIKIELMLYLIHGLLHLIGYDDLSEKDIRMMRKKEKEYIDYINLDFLHFRAPSSVRS